MPITSQTAQSDLDHALVFAREVKLFVYRELQPEQGRDISLTNVLTSLRPASIWLEVFRRINIHSRPTLILIRENFDRAARRIVNCGANYGMAKRDNKRC